MFYYIDENTKTLFICPPKCGNTTLSNFLNIPLNQNYENTYLYDILTNSNYKKVLVLRNPFERFLSGFYEDLNNNSCYENIHISFANYCEFLNYCHDNKLTNVNNLNVFFKNENEPIWWGNCSNLTLPITDEYGSISGHIGSMCLYVENITFNADKLEIIDIKDLSTFLQISKNEIKNTKNYGVENEYNVTPHMLLSKLKHLKTTKNYCAQAKFLYTPRIYEIIKNIYKIDFDFIEELNKKYNLNYTYQ
jgi:hypothetical protein